MLYSFFFFFCYFFFFICISSLGDLDNDDVAVVIIADNDGVGDILHYPTLCLSVDLSVSASVLLSLFFFSLYKCLYILSVLLSVWVLFWGVKLLIARTIVFFQQILTLNDLVFCPHKQTYTNIHILTNKSVCGNLNICLFINGSKLNPNNGV